VRFREGLNEDINAFFLIWPEINVFIVFSSSVLIFLLGITVNDCDFFNGNGGLSEECVFSTGIVSWV